MTRLKELHILIRLLYCLGATTINDETSSFTNYGECVTLFAPGSDIVSTTHDDKAIQQSGTSMAAGIVAGAIARLHSTSNDARTPDEVSLSIH